MGEQPENGRGIACTVSHPTQPRNGGRSGERDAHFLWWKVTVELSKIIRTNPSMCCFIAMKTQSIKTQLLVLLLLLSATLTEAQTPKTKGNYTLRATAELGFLGALSHKIQFGNNGTYFDYVQDGGQDVLFNFVRPSLELEVNDRNTYILLIQPLALESTVYLENDLIVDDLTFPATSTVDLLYGFPFYRFSYLRKLKASNNTWEWNLGGTIQIRNATISFRSTDGELFRTNRDVGIVPALKLRTKYTINNWSFAELEADGIYAPVSYLNGSTNEVVGAILDASLRYGLDLTDEVSAFLNTRYIGGGAVGTSDDAEGPSDGYQKNWLHFGTVSAGFTYTFE
jgi:hypothetical protein